MKLLKTLVSLIIILTIVSNITMVQASDTNEITTDDIFTGADDFIKAGEDEDTVIDDDDIKNVSDIVYNILLVIGIVAAVIVGLIIAMKLMLGSSTEKAQTKEMLIPYIVGCVVIFGAFGIWKLVVQILNQT